MQRNSKVHFIPPIPKREQHVGIYCRVSTNSMEQLQSLTAQVSHLTRLTAAMPQWVLADVYGYCYQQDRFIKERIQSSVGRLRFEED